MSTAAAKYENLVESFSSIEGVTVSQMFGKPCLKVNGKAFVSLHKETVVFKLAGTHHRKAMSIDGAALWDPSGKGRPMKEWVAMPPGDTKQFKSFASAALLYVSGSA